MIEGLKEKVSNDHEGGGNLFFSITRLMPQVREAFRKKKRGYNEFGTKGGGV